MWRINHDKKAERNLFSSVLEMNDRRLLLSGFIETLQRVWIDTTTRPRARLAIVRDRRISWNDYPQKK